MPKFKDISGQRFGLLVAQKPIKVRTSKRTRIKWECKCDCGNIAVVTGSNLASGHTKISGLFDELDRLGVPFWVQNSVICFSENWRKYIQFGIFEPMKEKNIIL